MKVKSFFFMLGMVVFSTSFTYAAGQKSNLDQDKKIKKMEQQLSRLQAQVKQIKQNTNHSVRVDKSCQPIRSRVIFGDSVVTAPYTEQPTYVMDKELVINSPSINTDVKLLYRRKIGQEMLLKRGIVLPQRPRLVLSGKVEAQAKYNRPYQGRRTSDIDLSGAELDIFAEMTSLLNGLITINYDNGSAGSPRRISNSRVKLDKGFITIGDFRRSAFYGTIGQMYVPFGRYGSNMISSPVTKFVGRTQARAIVVGYDPESNANLTFRTPYFSPYIRAFMFKGDSQYGNNKFAKQFGADLGVDVDKGALHSNLGVSYINNMADAEGMQNNGVSNSSYFRGFDGSNGERLKRRVRGVNFYGTFSYSRMTLLAEYVSALQSFNKADMQFNSHGAKPRAFNAELAYLFDLSHFPTSVAVGYARTSQALALNLPRQRYSAGIKSTVLQNTTVSLEYFHDKNYNRSDVAEGAGKSASHFSEQGRSNDSVVLQVGVYF